MVNHILLSVDGSAYTDWCREAAIQMLAPQGRLTILHVIDIVALEGTFLQDLSGAIGIEPYLNLSPKLDKILQEKGASILEAQEAACKKARVQCRTEMVTGVIANEISKRAVEHDLVVVGQRGANARFHAGLAGSVSEVLVRKSPRPVLVIPNAPRPIERVLLAFDGSAPAGRAMSHAARLCGDKNLSLTVLCVGDDEKDTENPLAEARRYFEGTAYPVHFEARIGKVNDEIIKAAKEHDVLVMGAHGHSRIVELVIGSTTEFVLRNAPVPVLFEK